MARFAEFDNVSWIFNQFILIGFDCMSSTNDVMPFSVSLRVTNSANTGLGHVTDFGAFLLV
jgi:hypothetical protein